MSKGQTSAVISVLVSAAIALLAIFGYNVIVVQPAVQDMQQAVQELNEPLPGFDVASSGVSNFNDIEVDNVTAATAVVGQSVRVGTDYAVEASAAGQELYFRTQLTPVAVSTVSAATHGVQTPVAAGCSPRAPNYAGAWGCRTAIGASGQITITMMENDATPVAGSYSVWIMGQ